MSTTIDFSKDLRDKVDDILSVQVTNENTITGIIYSPYLEDFRISLEEISLNMDERFIDNHADVIGLTFNIALVNYLYIINLYQDLRCNITISNNIKTSNPVWPRDDIVIDHRIIFVNKDDILKNISRSDVMLDDTRYNQDRHIANKITVEAQLVDDDTFELRKKQYGCIFRNTTLERVIHFLVGKFNPSGKFIVAPDNKIEYENVVIPGLMPFNEIFHHLDKEYNGIYNTGLGYYMLQGIFYTYPLYNFNPDDPSHIVHIYMVGNNTFLGAKNYHIFKDGDWHILANMGSTSKQLMESSTENVGNGFMVFKDSIEFDGWRTQSDDGTFSIIEEPIIQMQLDNDNTLSGASHNLRYKYGEKSLSKCRSELSLMNGTLFNINWDHASPYVIRPGGMIMIHYDGANGYETKSGVCIHANYNYTSVARDGVDRIYNCKANITLLTET